MKKLTRCGASRGPSAIAELLVETCHYEVNHEVARSKFDFDPLVDSANTQFDIISISKCDFFSYNTATLQQSR